MIHIANQVTNPPHLVYEMLFCEDERIITTPGLMLACHIPGNSCFPLCYVVVAVFCVASLVKCLIVKSFSLLIQLFELPISFLHGRGSSFVSKQTLHELFYSQKKSIGIAFKVKTV